MMTRRDEHDELCQTWWRGPSWCPECEFIGLVRANERERVREQARERTRELARRVLARGDGVSDTDSTP